MQAAPSIRNNTKSASPICLDIRLFLFKDCNISYQFIAVAFSDFSRQTLIATMSDAKNWLFKWRNIGNELSDFHERKLKFRFFFEIYAKKFAK